VKRRTFLAALGAAAAACSFSAQAQQPKIPRVGHLWIGLPEPETNTIKGLKKGLVAHKATATVPIVTIGDDLVGVGFAESLAHEVIE
jgi:hypothetical protein